MADPIKGKAAIVYDHMKSKRKGKESTKKQSEEMKRWSKPPPGWTKLNVDGSWKEEELYGGTGMILRDEEGGIIVAACRHLGACASPLEAEARACIEGLALALERTDRPILCESDCQELTSMVNEAGVNRSSIAALVNEIKRLCNGTRMCQVRHINRERNVVSRSLARFGCFLKCTNVWTRSGPEFIRDACNQDQTLLP
jgi:ribonuclease HI